VGTFTDRMNEIYLSDCGLGRLHSILDFTDEHFKDIILDHISWLFYDTVDLNLRGFINQGRLPQLVNVVCCQTVRQCEQLNNLLRTLHDL